MRCDPLLTGAHQLRREQVRYVLLDLFPVLLLRHSGGVGGIAVPACREPVCRCEEK